MTLSSNLDSQFMQVYETLKSELIYDPSFEFDDDSCQWVERMIDYTVLGGKMVRGYSVVDNYQLLKGEELTEDETFLVCALGNDDYHLQLLSINQFCILLINDYLDTFDDPDVFGKTRTDIEECKCSWLITEALELANEEQKKILRENYGIKDPAKVAKVKELYHSLDLKVSYYETNLYEKSMTAIKAHPNIAVQAVLKSCLEKMYK
ncbi:chrysanthemyl diphosphate synthase [Tanacetum coccineum]